MCKSLRFINNYFSFSYSLSLLYLNSYMLKINSQILFAFSLSLFILDYSILHYSTVMLALVVISNLIAAPVYLPLQPPLRQRPGFPITVCSPLETSMATAAMITVQQPPIITKWCGSATFLPENFLESSFYKLAWAFQKALFLWITI